MEKWNQYSKKVRSNKKLNYFFAPITFYKNVWEDLGGYDTLFRRSREDSDLVQRALHMEVKLIQTFDANVYHFSCVSSRGKKWFDANNQEAQSRVQAQNIADQIELRKFIRNWGGFNHGQEPLKKYDIDLVVVNADKNINAVYSVEPYFSRVWVDSEELVKSIIDNPGAEHVYANALLNFRPEDWEKASVFYNQVDYTKIYKHGNPTDYNAAVFVDAEKLANNQDFYRNLHFLHKILEQQQEEQSLDFGNSVLHIKKIVEVTKLPKVINPKFDMSLLVVE
jgi:hypothetical protein